MCVCAFTICSFHLQPLQFHFFRVKEKESLELSMKHSRRQLGGKESGWQRSGRRHCGGEESGQVDRDRVAGGLQRVKGLWVRLSTLRFVLFCFLYATKIIYGSSQKITLQAGWRVNRKRVSLEAERN